MNKIIDDFKFFDNWLDKYQYIIDLGKELPEYPEKFKTDEYKVRGCQSQVWMHAEKRGDKLHFVAISDAAIVSGLIYILLQVYNDKTPEEILSIKPDFIQQIGLDQHLSPTRKNGLYAMLQKIEDYAKGLFSINP